MGNTPAHKTFTSFFTSCLFFLFFFICSDDVSFMLAPLDTQSAQCFYCAVIVLMAAGKVRGHRAEAFELDVSVHVAVR